MKVLQHYAENKVETLKSAYKWLVGLLNTSMVHVAPCEVMTLGAVAGGGVMCGLASAHVCVCVGTLCWPDCCVCVCGVQWVCACMCVWCTVGVYTVLARLLSGAASSPTLPHDGVPRPCEGARPSVFSFIGCQHTCALLTPGVHYWSLPNYSPITQPISAFIMRLQMSYMIVTLLFLKIIMMW